MRDAPSVDSADGISTPCNGRPAQEQEVSAKNKAPVARSRPGALAPLTMVRARLRPVWKMEKSQDNSQRPTLMARIRHRLDHLVEPKWTLVTKT
jgi:hypothetical protein